MNKDEWEELVAQVEEHGPEAIVILDGYDNECPLIDVHFEDGKIHLHLGTPV